MRLNWITDRPYSEQYTKDVRDKLLDGQRSCQLDINCAVGVYDAGPVGDFMVKRAKAGLWFWVKVLVVGFMLIFPVLSFCT